MSVDYEQQAEDWYAAWNAHDIRAITSLYAENIVFISPYLNRMGLSERGVTTDHAAFLTYVKEALPRMPNLKFEPVANCIGVQGHTLVYRNQSGHIVTETHEYNDEGLIRLATASYSGAPQKRKTHGSR